jgi:hypothetical protein
MDRNYYDTILKRTFTEEKKLRLSLYCGLIDQRIPD